MAARSVATRPSPNEKSRPAAAHVVAFIGGAMVRDMPLSCNGPARWAPGAISTVDFLLYRFGAIVKKMAVKSHDWTGRRSASVLTRILAIGIAQSYSWESPKPLARRDAGQNVKRR